MRKNKSSRKVAGVENTLKINSIKLKTLYMLFSQQALQHYASLVSIVDRQSPQVALCAYLSLVDLIIILV